MNTARCSDIQGFVKQIDSIQQLSSVDSNKGQSSKITATMLQTFLDNNQIYWAASRNPIVGSSLKELSLRVEKELKNEKNILDRISLNLPHMTFDEPIVLSLLTQLEGSRTEIFKFFRSTLRVSKLWKNCTRIAKIEWINNHQIKLCDDVEMKTFSQAFQYALTCGIRLKHLGFAALWYRESPAHVLDTSEIGLLAEKCPNLTSVELNHIRNSDLSLFLSLNTDLTSLNIFANAEVYEINSLPPLLKNLKLASMITIQEYPRIWPNLESITIDRNRLPSSYPTSLKRLEIKGCMMPENLPNELLELEIENSEQQSFFELDLPNTLTSLHFLKCDKLTHMPKKLPINLRSLKVVANTRLLTMPSLPHSLNNFVFEIYDGMSSDYPSVTSVMLPVLPPNLEKFKLVNYNVHFPDLPESLKHLIVDRQRDMKYLKDLPEGLIRLSLLNSFIGAFPNLPSNLQVFELHKCIYLKFRYTSIPSTLRKLSFSSDCEEVFLNAEIPKECTVYHSTQ